jgi:cytochrome c biogenesis protein CcmG/thiol:disulfide interchange protein DsbE
MPPISTWLRGRALVIVVGVAALALSGVLALGIARGVGDSPLGEVEAGFNEAADFTLPTFAGGTFTLSEYTDGPIFIYFWASWCAPCFREAPLIERLWPEFRAAGYMFVGVNILDSEPDARAFIERFDLSFPLVMNLDSEEDVGTFVEQFDLSLPRVMDSRDIYLAYGVYGLPEAFFVRPGLLVDRKFIGELTESVLREMLAALADD